MKINIIENIPVFFGLLIIYSLFAFLIWVIKKPSVWLVNYFKWLIKTKLTYVDNDDKNKNLK